MLITAAKKRPRELELENASTKPSQRDQMCSLHRLGVRTRVDLRRKEEIRTFGNGGIGRVIVVTLSIPLPSSLGSDTLSTQGLSDYIVAMVSSSPMNWRVRHPLFAEPTHRAAVLHCYAGKDALACSRHCASGILGILGIPEDLVTVNYALTSLTSEKFLALADAELAPQLPQGGLLDKNSPTLSSKPETMAHLLTWIKCGFRSDANFVEWAGVSREAVDLLRR